jgi:hypothetical protein
VPAASWVAGAVRAQALSQRRIGPYRANEIARQASLADALAMLRPTAYGERTAEATSLAEAQRGVDATLIWHLRVLAGWLPREGAAAVETIAGWWELDNIRTVLAGFEGVPGEPLHDLGPFATLRQLERAGDAVDLRQRLRRSPWGDPGSDEPAEMLRYLRLRLALRISELGGPATRWASQRAAIWIAEDRFVDERRSPQRVLRRLPRFSTAGPQASSIVEFTSHLYADVARPFAGIEQLRELPAVEVRWWEGVDGEAETLLSRSRLGRDAWLPAVALLGVDAWRTKAALAMAARGGGSLRRELSHVA